jgi:hypothetical protein
MIGSDYFIIEMSFNNRGFFISLFCIADENKHKVLELVDSEKTRKILKTFENNYEIMAKNIKIVNGYIKIKKPTSYSTINAN